jgi:putative transcriptional regulator
MSDEERRAAAMADPDVRPITEEDKASGRLPLVPRTITLRRALRLSQQDFSERFCIPIGTLRDWEQGRKEPDTAAKAYLHVIASEPEMVRKALSQGPGSPRSSGGERSSRKSDAQREARGLEEAAAPRLAKHRKKRSR